MAGGMDLGTSGKGGKKPLDVAINLVPFIDLMAVTIAFLIMTAVWTQIGRLQVSSAGAESEQTEQQRDQTPPIQVNIALELTQIKLVAGGAEEPIEIRRDDNKQIDVKPLLAKLEELKKTNGVAAQYATTLRAADEVPYEDVMRIVDSLSGAGFKGVTIAGQEG